MIELTLRNVISKGSSFRDFETTIRFIVSKRVRRWSRFLISSPGWSYLQNEAQLNGIFYSFSQKKWHFLQTNPNIGILYTIGNHFSPWLTIRDRYLKIWLRLARINYQSFVNLYGIMCHQPRHFRHEWRVPLRWEGHKELIYTHRRWWGWPETAFCCRSPRNPPCRWLYLSARGAGFPPIVVVWSSSYYAWGSMMVEAGWSRGP